jgi:hypothetical protein
VTKSKPVAPKPVLAWCLLYGDEIKPQFCSSTKRRAIEWQRTCENGMDNRIIRVEIRPAPKRKGAKP